MGWTFIDGATREMLVAEVTKGSIITHGEKTPEGYEVVAIHEHPDGFRFFVLTKLEPGQHGWGYKMMSEDMGPHHSVSVPRFFLDIANEKPAPDGKLGPYSKGCRARMFPEGGLG